MWTCYSQQEHRKERFIGAVELVKQLKHSPGVDTPETIG
jgi:hypothetical protein